ncbi:MAG: protein-L-isoaspartate O-methyltransferase [Candidatus Liptonbacteria bacterium]|nr:protein-L-isoaspartate O-methyltransferase [Candidatus Liptonbacteria bacterium]
MTKEDLIQELRAYRVLKSPSLIRAFYTVDRRGFVPPEYAEEAYGDYPISIGFGQTISQPLTVAFMLELLLPRPGDSVLEIGAGSGWQAALLGYVVSGGGTVSGKRRQCAPVVTMERVLPLCDMASANIRGCPVIRKGVVEVVAGDGSRGHARCAPYDRIIAAATTGSIPVAWKEQLRVGGRIVAPVEDTIEVHDKLSTGDYNIRVYHGFRFVPLVTDEREGG